MKRAVVILLAGWLFPMVLPAQLPSEAIPMVFVQGAGAVNSFYIGKFEVTQGQWKAVMGTGLGEQRDKVDPARSLNGEGDDYPMYYVNWDDAQEFISRLNASTGKNYRLPTEAEWEFAARGGDQSKGYQYSGSNDIRDVAWYVLNSGMSTKQTGAKQPNELGIYDMSGNVREWCQDAAATGANRVVRGGSFFGVASFCRVSNRDSNTPGFRSNFTGFRVAHSEQGYAQSEANTTDAREIAIVPDARDIPVVPDARKTPVVPDAREIPVTPDAAKKEKKSDEVIPAGPVYLLTAISYDDKSRSKFEYDQQNRFTKMTNYDSEGAITSESAIRYNSNGDLVSYENTVKNDFGNVSFSYTYVTNGNTITVYEGKNKYAAIVLNAEGLPENAEIPSERYVATYQYQNGNLIELRGGWIESESFSYSYTYDDRRTPFYHCKTPKWFLLYSLGYDVNNNALTRSEGGAGYEISQTYTYTYHAAGFPLTVKKTVQVKGEDSEEWVELKEETKTGTYQYEQR